MTYEIGSAEAEGQNVLHAKNKLASCQWHRPFLFFLKSDSGLCGAELFLFQLCRKWLGCNPSRGRTKQSLGPFPVLESHDTIGIDCIDLVFSPGNVTNQV